MSDEQKPPSPSAIPMAVVFYDPDAPDGKEMVVGATPEAVEMLAYFSDIELSIFAVEAGSLVRKLLELPPSPKREK